MALNTILRVLIEGDASGLIGQLTKAGRESKNVFSEVSRSAKAEFAAATREADKAFKEVARLQAMAARAEKGGSSGYAAALRAQAATKAVEADKFAAVAVSAEKRIQAEAARTVTAHAAEAAGVSKLGGAYAQQGGAIQHFLGSFSASGGAAKNLTVLQSAMGGLSKSSGALGTAAGGVGSVLAKLGTGAGGAAAALGPAGIAAGAAAVGVGALAKTVASGLDHFQKYAAEVRGIQKLTGATASDASLLAGQFRYFGIDVDAASKALGIFAKNAATDGGRKLTELGISIGHTRTGSIDLVKTFENAGDAFKRFGVGAEGTNLALKAFGRGGAVVIPILNQTKDAIHGINAETAKQGLLFTQEELNNAKELSIATREVRHSFEGLQVSVAKGFAPAFTELADGASGALNTVNSLGDFIGGVAKGAADAFESLGNIGGKKGLLGDVVPKGVQDALGTTAKSSGEAADKLKELGVAGVEAGAQMSDAFALTTGAAIKAGQANLGYKDSLRGLAQAFAENGKTLNTNTDAGRKNATAALAVVSAAQADGEAIAQSTGKYEKGTKAVEHHKAELLALLAAQLGSRGAAEKFALDFGLIDKAGAKAARGVKLTKEQVFELLGLGPKISDFVKGFQSSIASATDPSSALTKASTNAKGAIQKAVEAAESGSKVLVGRQLVPPEFFSPDIGPLAAKLHEAEDVLNKLPADAGDAARKLAQGNVDAARSALEDLPNQASASLAEFQGVLEGEIIKVAAFEGNLRTLASRGHIALAEEFAKMGPSAAGLVADAVTRSDAALVPLEADFRTRAQQATGATAAALEQGSQDWSSILAVKGKLTVQSLAEALGVAPTDTQQIVDRVRLVLNSLPPETRVTVKAIAETADATAKALAFTAAMEAARRNSQNPIVFKVQVQTPQQNPFDLRFGGKVRETGGPVQRSEQYNVGEKGQELYVPAQETTASKLVAQADKESRAGLVRLNIPGGIEPKAKHEGAPALMLGKQGPHTFTPPSEGFIVNARDTKRLKRTDDPGIIERILKRAGAKKPTLDALQSSTMPARYMGGPAKRGQPHKTGEKDPELFVPARKTPRDASAAKHLATAATADRDSLGALVRLALPGGVESGAAHRGTQALLLGQQGPQIFVPPTDGVIVNASDTKRLQRTDDEGVISRILKRAGADRRTLDALARGPDVPERAGGGRVQHGESYKVNEKGTEAFLPTFNFARGGTAPATAPNIKRGSDGSYSIQIGDTHLNVEGVTSGSTKGVSKVDVEAIVRKHQANMANELARSLEQGKR